MWSTRSLRALAFAALLSIPTAVPASATPSLAVGMGPAATSRGVTGPVATHDQADMTGVACVFLTRAGVPVIAEILATPPQIHWPDRRPGAPDEHGKVTWRVIVQSAKSEENPAWSRSALSRVRTGVAGEGAPASLTTVRVPIPAGTKRWLRVIHLVTWRARDGRVLGSLRRVQQWTSLVIDGQGVSIGSTACPSILSEAMLVPAGP